MQSKTKDVIIQMYIDFENKKIKNYEKYDIDKTTYYAFIKSIKITKVALELIATTKIKRIEMFKNMVDKMI
jgi:hypothetical protein